MFMVPLQHNSDRVTLLDGNCMCHMSAKFKAFHFWTTKKLSLFSYSVVLYSVFYRHPVSCVYVLVESTTRNHAC